MLLRFSCKSRGLWFYGYKGRSWSSCPIPRSWCWYHLGDLHPSLLRSLTVNSGSWLLPLTPTPLPAVALACFVSCFMCSGSAPTASLQEGLWGLHLDHGRFGGDWPLRVRVLGGQRWPVLFLLAVWCCSAALTSLSPLPFSAVSGVFLDWGAAAGRATEGCVHGVCPPNPAISGPGLLFLRAFGIPFLSLHLVQIFQCVGRKLFPQCFSAVSPGLGTRLLCFFSVLAVVCIAVLLVLFLVLFWAHQAGSRLTSVSALKLRDHAWWCFWGLFVLLGLEPSWAVFKASSHCAVLLPVS